MLRCKNIDLLVNDAGWRKNNRLKMVLTVLERLRSSCGIDDMINLRYVILNFIYDNHSILLAVQKVVCLGDS